MSVGHGPSASIVITNYNYQRFVGAAIESAAAQTVPVEVIVVDDGSTDRSRSTIDDLAQRHPDTVRTVMKDNGGQASAFNAGWRAATAEVVLFLDGDDTLDPDAVERVLDRLAGEPDAVRCQFRLRWIDADGGVVRGGFPEPRRLLPAGDLRAAMVDNPDDLAWQPTSGNAFRASLLRRLLPMPEDPYRVSADHYLSNLSALYGPIVAIEQQLGSYRVHGDNHDHRSGFDVERARDILRRTEVTRGLLLEHGGRLGLAMPATPDDYRSLTTAGLRLSSFRLSDRGSSGHPFPDDRRRSLVARGLAAVAARDDFSPIRRVLAGLWFVALAAAPRSLVPAIAGRALTR